MKSILPEIVQLLKETDDLYVSSYSRRPRIDAGLATIPFVHPI